MQIFKVIHLNRIDYNIETTKYRSVATKQSYLSRLPRHFHSLFSLFNLLSLFAASIQSSSILHSSKTLKLLTFVKKALTIFFLADLFIKTKCNKNALSFITVCLCECIRNKLYYVLWGRAQHCTVVDFSLVAQNCCVLLWIVWLTSHRKIIMPEVIRRMLLICDNEENETKSFSLRWLALALLVMHAIGEICFPHNCM